MTNKTQEKEEVEDFKKFKIRKIEPELLTTSF